MSNRSLRILTVLWLAVLWLAGVAQAQYAPHFVKVSVPFDFTVNGKSFSAGEYSLACTPVRIELRDAQAHVVAMLIPHSVESLSSPTAPKLVFTTEEGGYTLKRVWLHGERIGYELAPSKAAIALAKRRSTAPAQVRGGGNKP